MNLESYLADPADHFDCPESVLRHTSLSAEDKKEILLSWKDELMQLQTATEENMPLLDDRPSERASLRQVQLALDELNNSQSCN